MTDEQIRRYSRHTLSLNEVGVKVRREIVKGQGAYYRCRRTWSSGNHVSCSGRVGTIGIVDADEGKVVSTCRDRLSTEPADVGKAEVKSTKRDNEHEPGCSGRKYIPAYVCRCVKHQRAYQGL